MSTVTQTFEALGLNSSLLSSIKELGYEAPTPVQEKSIPILLKGDDLLAQAQTGTGKTAAFALPILANIDSNAKHPQALVLAPTRELAIQTAEAFQRYAKHMKDFRVAAIYGGQDMQIQLRALKRGVQVVVGTPGRLMDHLRRGSLSIHTLKMVVLDEADEMLNMGFIDDIEWILEQIPQEYQTACFSATMPPAIAKIAKRYLKDAEKVQIQPGKNEGAAIEQSYMIVAGNQKIEALTRFLEVEVIDACIVFVRTKNISAELAEKLQARGYAAAALNGDMSQSLREKVIERLKKGSLDFIVATDVAARGIDVARVSHVINFDIPYDTDAYVHRIGRTGRAGRQGKALLIITHRENRLLRDIQRAIPQTIKAIEPPSIKEMSEKRADQLGQRIVSVLEKSKGLNPSYALIEQIIAQNTHGEKDIAAALVYLMQQANPLPTGELNTAPIKEDRNQRPFDRSARFRKSDKPSSSFHKKKSSSFKGKSSEFKEKPSRFKEKSSSFKGKSSEFKEKPSRFKEKSSSFKGKFSGFKEKSSEFKEKSVHFKRKPSEGSGSDATAKRTYASKKPDASKEGRFGSPRGKKKSSEKNTVFATE